MKKKLILISIMLVVIFLIVFFVFYREKEKNKNKNFVMYIEEGYMVNKDLYLTGISMNGKVSIGDELEVVGNGTKEVTVKDIIVDNKSVKKYSGKKRFSVSIGETDIEDLKRGTALATKDAVKETQKVVMKITLDAETQVQVKKGSVLVFKIGFENYAGTVDINDSLVATQTGEIEVTFDDKVPAYKDAEVVVKYDGLNTIGTGKIIELK